MSWQNWARTEKIDPVHIVEPSTADEVAGAVREAAGHGQRFKAIGAGHSFSGAAVAPGVQMLPTRLHGVHSIDRDTGLVTLDAGIALHELNPLLARHGLAMEILGDIDRQTIAGAISTGTHGSGERFGSISTQVRALELVLADGSIVCCSEDENCDLYDAARVSVGAVGVITKVTLQCVPLYALHAVDAPMPLDEVLSQVDELVAENDHFEFFWFPHTQTALTRRFQRLPGETELHPMSPLVQTIDDRLITNIGFEAMLRVGTRFPRLVPGITRFVTRAISARDFTDLAPNVFASERNVRFREGEYFLPREHLVPALRELKAWVDSHDVPVSFPFEVRFVRRDDIWLSPAYERDSAVVSFHQYHRMEHRRWFAICEDVLGALAGRPHWGKLHRMDADALSECYPRFDDFRRVRDQVDPDRVFANDYLDRVLGK